MIIFHPTGECVGPKSGEGEGKEADTDNSLTQAQVAITMPLGLGRRRYKSLPTVNLYASLSSRGGEEAVDRDVESSKWPRYDVENIYIPGNIMH